MVEGFSYDIEGDDLYLNSTKVWVIVYKDLNNPDKKLIIHPFVEDCKQKVIDWLDSYNNPVIVAHYGLGYDIFMQMRYVGINFTVGPDTIDGKPCRFVDTYYMSMCLDSDLDGHSIEAWGDRLGLHKIDFRQRMIDLGIIDSDSPDGAEFKQYHEEMDVYCERDVDVNIKVFQYLWGIFTSWYTFDEDGNLPDHYRSGQKSFFLMSCQEFTGWKFDIEYAKEVYASLQAEMRKIEGEVEPQLPPRKLKKSEEDLYTMPAKPFKKDGTLSANMLKFIEKHDGKIIEDDKLLFYGKEYFPASKKMLDVQLPMTMSNQNDLKDWLLERGWKPTLWNYKRGPDGKPERDPKTRKLIETTPKIQEAGKICENLLEMDGDLIKGVVRWLSLRNRSAVLETWMAHERLEKDGRIGCARTSITPTHRQRHSVVVNVPKAAKDVLFGIEFRKLWTHEKGFKIAAGDAAALEARVEAHYTWKYDGGESARELLEGDVHSKNAKVFYPEETFEFDITSEDFDKDHPVFKPFRSKSKNGKYALTYGCAPPKLASTLGKPVSEGNRLYDAFWKANPALASLKEAVERFWENQGGKAWLPAIDGRRLKTRKKSALLNTLFQACGAIAMDYACCFLDNWLGGIKFDKDGKPYYSYKGYVVRRIAYMHDEIEFECEEDIAEEISKLIEKAITKAGEHLKLSVPLAGEGKVGDNWCDVH